MEFRLLGPLEVVDDEGRPLALGGPRHRAVLGLLARDAGRVVPSSAIVDALYGDEPPPTAVNAVQGYVSGLRRSLGSRWVRTVPPGYVLDAASGEVDLHLFDDLVRQGRAALREPDPRRASAVLAQALALVRGRALADVDLDYAEALAARVEETVHGALRDRVDADLELGRHAGLVGELFALVAGHPLDEGLRARLVLALSRSGRQTEALEQYAEARDLLQRELGLDPGPELRDIHRLVLAQEPAAQHAPPLALRRVPGLPCRTIGRADDVAALAGLLADPGVRVVTLTGPGGVGKTHLALEVAAAVQERYDGGALFVPLAAVTDPALLHGALAAALCVEETGRTARATVLSALAGERILVVLDNVEQLLDAAPLVAELVAELPGLDVLVTSRAPLRIRGEREHRLGPLSAAAAAELFAERAAGVRAGVVVTPADHLAVEEICRRLDGLPLALELAAARTRLLSLDQLFGLLDHRLPLLTGGPRDLPERQRTLRATIDWSYRLLPTDQRRLLPRLAVFMGAADLQEAALMCADLPSDALDLTEALVDASLLWRRDTSTGPRVAMLETVREFALEQLYGAGEATRVHALACRHLLGLLRRVDGAVDPAWLASGDQEADNLRGCLAWAVAEDPRLAAELAAAAAQYFPAQRHAGRGSTLAERSRDGRSRERSAVRAPLRRGRPGARPG